jgi:hypothetical protein
MFEALWLLNVKSLRLVKPELANVTVFAFPCAPSAVAAMTVKVAMIFFIGRMSETLRLC